MELLLYGNSSDLYIDKYELTEGIILFLVVIPIINQLGWVEVSK